MPPRLKFLILPLFLIFNILESSFSPNSLILTLFVQTKNDHKYKLKIKLKSINTNIRICFRKWSATRVENNLIEINVIRFVIRQQFDHVFGLVFSVHVQREHKHSHVKSAHHKHSHVNGNVLQE